MWTPLPVLTLPGHHAAHALRDSRALVRMKPDDSGNQNSDQQRRSARVSRGDEVEVEVQRAVERIHPAPKGRGRAAAGRRSRRAASPRLVVERPRQLARRSCAASSATAATSVRKRLAVNRVLESLDEASAVPPAAAALATSSPAPRRCCRVSPRYLARARRRSCRLIRWTTVSA